MTLSAVGLRGLKRQLWTKEALHVFENYFQGWDGQAAWLSFKFF